VFALIWGAYVLTDALAEVGGALFGRQRLRVWGVGDVNRKSVGGLVTGLAGGLVFCIGMVVSYGLPAPWIGLAIAVAISSSVFELLSPRGTDDFTMATANAVICLGFGMFVR
jgi:dolichol kinase